MISVLKRNLLVAYVLNQTISFNHATAVVLLLTCTKNVL